MAHYSCLVRVYGLEMTVIKAVFSIAKPSPIGEGFVCCNLSSQERHQGQEASTLDGRGDLTLVTSAGTRATMIEYASVRVDELAEILGVLVVHILHVIGA
jgi:hypothetical protein